MMNSKMAEVFTIAPFSRRVVRAKRTETRRRRQNKLKRINPVANQAINVCVVILRLLELAVFVPIGLLAIVLDKLCDRWGGKTVAAYISGCFALVIAVFAMHSLSEQAFAQQQELQRETRAAIVADIKAETEPVYLVIESDPTPLEEEVFWERMAVYLGEEDAQAAKQVSIDSALENNQDFAEAYFLSSFPPYANYEIPEVLIIGGAEFSAANNNSARYANVEEFFAFWDEKGLPRRGICGLAGNWFVEYSMYVYRNDSDSKHFGMFQIGKTYAGETSELYAIYCNQYVDRNTLGTQCQFVYDVITGKWDEEITTNYGHIWDELVNAESAGRAAEIFSTDFEKGGHTQKRMEYAEAIFDQTAFITEAPGL